MATEDKNPADEVGADEVQAKFDEANAKGYFGETPREEDNHEFTLRGVTAQNKQAKRLK